MIFWHNLTQNNMSVSHTHTWTLARYLDNSLLL
ncbi:hypothetical protein NP493_42g11034 [Ridgeia piscesae]|uniref:Uncharacterized protein n=1 Tax=Ridgeia piscesae TaxID=27915 RepID=A0AAD9PBZ9_RIDPI|nr:hypothetical protein NP493_42g11034 [Ridgeia piscesae]